MPNPPFLIRPARASDRDVVVAFNLRLAQETESKRLDPEVLALGVSAALAEPDRLRYWVAELEGVGIVGQAAVTREWSDWRNGWLWWLQSVYVLAEYRQCGAFRALLGRIREAALEASPAVVGLRLYVEKENARAQRVYEALGFRPGGYFVLEDIWGIPPG